MVPSGLEPVTPRYYLRYKVTGSTDRAIRVENLCRKYPKFSTEFSAKP